jgi:metallophosphoesterase superfamily enzyme
LHDLVATPRILAAATRRRAILIDRRATALVTPAQKFFYAGAAICSEVTTAFSSEILEQVTAAARLVRH